METTPFFSVIVPTRDRADLFARALDSIAQQKTQDLFCIEVIVINDGSTEQQVCEYNKITQTCPISVHWISLPQRARGHGPSFSRNEGVSLAQGKYLCFLDDDDEWTDSSHLLNTFNFIKSNVNEDKAVLLFQQIAQHCDGTLENKRLWNADLVDKLAIETHRQISKKEYSQSAGFTHLNCLICSKKSFEEIGGFDETLRYEEDRDFNLRLIDQADTIFIFNKNIAKHYIPDRNKRNNASTALVEVDKALIQLCADIKLAAKIENPDLHRKIHEHLVYTADSLATAVQGSLQKGIFQRVVRGLKYSLAWFFRKKG